MSGQPSLGAAAPATSAVRHTNAEEACRHINKYVVDVVIHRCYKTFISWGCQKAPSDTFKKFIESRDPPKKWLKENQQKLDTTNADYFDVTLFSALLPIACPGIERAGTDAWVQKNKDPTSVEHLINKIKTIRNGVVHNEDNDACNPDTAQELEDLLIRFLEVGGKLYSVADSQVKGEVQNVKEWIEEPRTMTDKKTRIERIKSELEKSSETTENVKKFYTTDDTAMVSIIEVFHNPTLIVKDNSVDGEYREMTCGDIFQTCPGYMEAGNFLIIEGAPGSGKTTLLKRIALNAVKIGDHIFSAVDEFNFLIYIECRKDIRSFCDWMYVWFPNTLRKFETDDAVEAARMLNPLILIDGLDELNQNSTKLLKEVVEFFKSNANVTFVATCRPNTAMKTKEYLNAEGVKHNTVSIREMSSSKERENFIYRYQEKLQTTGVIDTFDSMQLPWKSHFKYPLFLALFCHVFKTSPDEVPQCKSETAILEQTLDNCREKMIKRLNQRQVLNVNVIVRKVIRAFTYVCLKCVDNDYMHLSQAMHDDFCETCYDKISSELDYTEVISSILVKKSSIYSPEDGQYHFFHDTQREYLASKAISRSITENGTCLLKDILKTGNEEAKCQKYLNILKIVVVDLVAGGQQQIVQRRLPELTDFLMTAGADWPYWAELTASCPNSEEVAEAAGRAAELVLQKVQEKKGYIIESIYTPPSRSWRVTTTRQVAATARMLRYGQPPVLSVVLPRSLAVTPELRKLISAIRDHYTGELELWLQYSYWHFCPCDETLVLLEGAKCRLTHLKVCIGKSSNSSSKDNNSYAAVNTITALLAEEQQLSISLQEPLMQNLIHLQAAAPGHNLSVRTKSIKPSRNIVPHPRRPLPNGRLPPTLTVNATNPMADVVTTVLTLAPVDMRYYALYLSTTRLKDADLHCVLQQLAAAGVGTTCEESGSIRWKESGKDGNGNCSTCRCFKHSDGERCVQLYLPKTPRGEFAAVAMDVATVTDRSDDSDLRSSVQDSMMDQQQLATDQG